MVFKPKIINLKKRDADKVLAEIDKKLQAGDYSGINTLEIIYLPLYGSESGKTTAQLLDTAIKLVPQVTKTDKHKQRKLHSLMALLACTFIGIEETKKIWEVNMRILEDNPFIVVVENHGMNRGRSEMAIEIAQNMLLDGDDYVKISRMTGLDVDRIAELDNELQANAI